MSERQNITLQVLPFAVPNRIAVTSSAMLLSLPEQRLASVYLEDFFGATYLYEPEDFTRYSVLFERLSSAALPHLETQQLIAKVLDDYAVRHD